MAAAIAAALAPPSFGFGTTTTALTATVSVPGREIGNPAFGTNGAL
ncbi:hypothetical protein SLEP1_g24358 [Rubroshorea leprosula]|uniref:Uncharacterized protein n=1 Tax=Rubroshorea leprosula TaxID=152421 RepID=A0AAV5JRH4_9ROSI|nr:hypothetical protein SLEP1_g24358 [Rubroshorea leprosula]